MELPHPIFAPTFDFCRDNFFPERKNEVLGELMLFIQKPVSLPKPTECGNYKIRTKKLLPHTNTIAYYWNFGRVWEFFGLVENENTDQLKELEVMMDKLKKKAPS